MNLIVLITGTSKGIGQSLALFFLEKGCTVYGCSRGKSTIIHTNYFHAEMDVSNENDVKVLFHNIKKNSLKLDILINNAGAASMNHFLLTPLSTVERLFKVNFIGTFLFSREAAKLMGKNKFGRIINFSTVAVPLRLEGEAVYGAIKSAIVNITETLSKELAIYGITVNAIGPTPIYTDLIKTIPEKKINELINKQSIKRLGTFDDVINVIEFFIKPSSNYITGQTIYLGGILN
jgi:3-oxoacyl-[acyl-carrier protein] reductase